MTRAVIGASVRSQYGALAIWSLVVVALAGALDLYDGSPFHPYFGARRPTLIIASLAVVGALCLAFLRSRGGFEICAPGGCGKGLRRSAALASLLALGMILVDVAVVLPRDLNVPLPQGLLFYPAIAHVAEVVFHLLPLTLLLVVLGPVIRRVGFERIIWPGLVAVALIEPVFQVTAGFSSGVPTWAEAYVGLNVFAFNLLQLYAFKRYDFAALLSLRLVYYLWWHIAWGALRLQLLF